MSKNLSKHNNNFDILRLLAASLVLFWHCFPAYNNLPDPTAPYINKDVGMGTIALAIFFVISGYLVTGSCLKNNILHFFYNRALRIMPGLVVVVLLCVFVMGPIVTSFTLSDYFASSLTWKYLNTILIIPLKYNLPGVFTENVQKGVVNGSLWSLELEVKCYFVLAMLGLAKLIKPKVVLCFTAFVGVVYIAILCVESPPKYIIGLKSADIKSYSEWFYFFFAGSGYYLLKDKIKYNFVIFAALCAALVLLCRLHIIGVAVFMLIFPYIVFYVAFSVKNISGFLKGNDISYGLYIYAWPVQQLYMKYIGDSFGFGTFVVSSFAVASLFGFLSWKLVEKPCLRLKAKS